MNLLIPWMTRISSCAAVLTLENYPVFLPPDLSEHHRRGAERRAEDGAAQRPLLWCAHCSSVSHKGQHRGEPAAFHHEWEDQESHTSLVRDCWWQMLGGGIISCSGTATGQLPILQQISSSSCWDKKQQLNSMGHTENPQVRRLLLRRKLSVEDGT